MTLTVEDIKERLKMIDECLLVDVLEITSSDIVDRFEDIIETNYDRLINELEDET